MRKLPLSILKAIGILAIVAWSILPIALIVLSSFKSDRDIFSLSSRFSFMPTLANYELLWSRWGDFFHGLWNSFVVTLGATLLAVLVSLLAGFAYSRHAGRGLQASAFFLIFVRCSRRS